MARLALALTGERTDRLPIDRQTSRVAFRALGEVVLLYRPVAEGLALFEATGVLAGVGLTEEGDFECRLRHVERLRTMQTRQRPETRRSRQMLELQAEQFAEILADGQLPPDPPRVGLEDMAAAFDGPLRDDLPIRMFRDVLEAYDYRCAVTGLRLAGAQSVELRPFFLKPRDQNGPLDPRNLMPMTQPAYAAWSRGTLSATAEHKLVAVVRDLDLGLFDRIEEFGTLHLPEDGRFRPDPVLLSYHFENVFGR